MRRADGPALAGRPAVLRADLDCGAFAYLPPLAASAPLPRRRPRELKISQGAARAVNDQGVEVEGGDPPPQGAPLHELPPILAPTIALRRGPRTAHVGVSDATIGGGGGSAP